MAGIVRWGVRGTALGVGALWWWAVLRLVTESEAGLLEAAVAAGGWGLSVLPVHCVPKRRAKGTETARRRRSVRGGLARRGMDAWRGEAR
ncbi:hypothetical protein [Streptomyces djakartensis]|uniref:hypothetical protein n=1 Tax=Streptomyces djakartensis TaxID=68193 RepID=UPI0034DF805B